MEKKVIALLNPAIHYDFQADFVLTGTNHMLKQILWSCMKINDLKNVM